MKIYTKTGDSGKTSLIGGTKVYKSDLRIESYGTVDELNSYLGLIRDLIEDERKRILLKEIQDRLFAIGASLASDPKKSKMKIPDLTARDIELLETEIDRLTETLPVLKYFILPGGDPVASYCHIARCVCRRAERLTVGLSRQSAVEPKVIVYLNRLSDYLFTLARAICKEKNVKEIHWSPRGKD